MPRTCTVCTHPERAAIDATLVSGPSESLRTIADRRSVSKTALIRHKADHLPAHLATAREAAEIAGCWWKELLAFRVKIIVTPHDTYEPWRERAHDDLVLAVALACWYGETYVAPACASVRSPFSQFSRSRDRWDRSPY
jgi:hypothetical protein